MDVANNNGPFQLVSQTKTNWRFGSWASLLNRNSKLQFKLYFKKCRAQVPNSTYLHTWNSSSSWWSKLIQPFPSSPLIKNQLITLPMMISQPPKMFSRLISLYTQLLLKQLHAKLLWSVAFFAVWKLLATSSLIKSAPPRWLTGSSPIRSSLKLMLLSMKSFVWWVTFEPI